MGTNTTQPADNHRTQRALRKSADCLTQLIIDGDTDTAELLGRSFRHLKAENPEMFQEILNGMGATDITKVDA